MSILRFIGFALFAILLCLSVACSSGGDELEPEPEIQLPTITNWYAGDQAFYDCDKLNNVTCLAETAPVISHKLSDNSLIYAFDEDYRGYLSVPKFSSSSYRLSDWSKFFTIVEMDE